MPIHVDIKDHIAVVTLDNPPVNALAADWDIPAVFDAISDNLDVHVAVLTAAGERVFLRRRRPEGRRPRPRG